MTDERRIEEVEIKIPVGDLDAVRRRLRERGAALAHPRHEESNDLYDTADERISRADSALRLRRTERESLLTFKGPARFDRGIKTREERETTVGDPAETEAILRRIGLERRFRYEKRREEWNFADCAIALDETPIGAFVEIEGAPPAIRRAVASLELDFASATPYPYPRLYEQKRKDDPRLPKDMVFDGGADR